MGKIKEILVKILLALLGSALIVLFGAEMLIGMPKFIYLLLLDNYVFYSGIESFVLGMLFMIGITAGLAYAVNQVIRNPWKSTFIVVCTLAFGIATLHYYESRYSEYPEWQFQDYETDVNFTVGCSRIFSFQPEDSFVLCKLSCDSEEDINVTIDLWDNYQGETTNITTSWDREFIINKASYALFSVGVGDPGEHEFTLGMIIHDGRHYSGYYDERGRFLVLKAYSNAEVNERLESNFSNVFISVSVFFVSLATGMYYLRKLMRDEG